MAEWRYLAQRLVGPEAGTFLDVDVPLSGVAITDMLSGPPRLSGTITPEYGRLRDPDGRLVLEEWGTAIYAEKDDEIQGGFIVAYSNFEGPVWALDCVGFTGYPKDMPYTDSKFFVEADPLDIVRHIWEHLQSHPDGNLNMQVDLTTSDKKIGTVLEQVEFDTQEGPVSFEAGPYKLAWYLTDDLGGAIDALARDTPFDYTEEHAWASDGSITHRLRLHFPLAGNRREDLRFVVGENIAGIPALERDGDEYANHILVLGAGEGSAMIRADAHRPDGRLRRAKVKTDKRARTTSAAASIANVELLKRQGIDAITEIQVRDHPHAPIGSWNVGDEILVQGDLGWTDIELWCRILSSTINPESGAAATLTIARTDTVR